MFKLEVLDHKTRERAGIINLSLGSLVPVLLRLDAAAEVIILLYAFKLMLYQCLRLSYYIFFMFINIPHINLNV